MIKSAKFLETATPEKIAEVTAAVRAIGAEEYLVEELVHEIGRRLRTMEFGTFMRAAADILKTSRLGDVVDEDGGKP